MREIEVASAAPPDRKKARLGLAVACAAWVLLGREAVADEAVASLRISAPAASAWATLTDFLAWDRIFPDVVRVSLEEGERPPLRMHQIVRVFGMEIEHTSSVTLEPDGYRLALALDPSRPHDVDGLEAVWTVSPDPDGGSVIELRSRITPSQPVPEFIRRPILQRTLRTSVEALAAEVTRRMGPIASADGS